MAENVTDIDSLTIDKLVQRAGEQGKEDFKESEMFYTIELLEAGMQDIIKEVQGLKKDFENIEKDAEHIKQELHLCAPQPDDGVKIESL